MNDKKNILQKMTRQIYSSDMLSRSFVWLNIIIQVLFPVATVFTPVIASENPFPHLTYKVAPISKSTRIYVLDENESTVSVARKFNISLAALRKLNQFRTFANGFDNLRQGDELDVPAYPLLPVAGNNNDLLSSEDRRSDAMNNKLARAASQAGTFFASSPNSDTTSAFMRNIATDTATTEIQDWLSKIGTARVSLNTDEHFSLEGSEFDLLVPLYDNGVSLTFTQASVHRTDGRTQTNLGFGSRYFTSDYMLGANLFGDYDLSRDHARVGTGFEYWRNFLKLSFNGYLPLTGWKDSPDREDYQERPARGWDLRAEGWLPALPQLGGKLIYEQYYGNEVALFGVDNRQKNPRAFTTGISYTPVPLVTMNAELRKGESGMNDAQFGIEVNYQPGLPWLQQISPSAVATMRSLAGSRYDLVERNNNIVLEYRKKEVISLHVADLITGYPSDEKSLAVSVNSKYGLERIDWSASSLTAAGGKIVQNGQDWSVVLPAHQSTADAVNTYQISAVAVDKKGNVSNRAKTQITVLAPQVSATQSTFTPPATTLPGDGKSHQVLKLTLRDSHGKAVDLPASEVKLTTSKENRAITVARPRKRTNVSALSRTSAGVFEATITAGEQAEKVTLTPSVQGISLPPATVLVDDIVPISGQSSIAVSKKQYTAGDDMKVTVTLKNKQGKGLIGESAALTADTIKVPNATLKSSWTDNGNGTYTATYKAKTAGSGLKAALKMNLWSQAVISARAYDITAGASVEKTSAISTDKDSYTAEDEMKITVTLKDAQGNAVSGKASALTGKTVTVPNAFSGSWNDNQDGTYTATYKAKTAGSDLKATLKMDGWSQAVKSARAYDITAGASVEKTSAISTDKDSYTAEDEMKITVTLKDAQGNAVSGKASALTGTTVTVPNTEAFSGSWNDNQDGTYTATYKAKTAGSDLKATLKMDGWSQAVKSARAYDITAGASVEKTSAISTDKASYTTDDELKITVTLKDAQGNAVSGKASALTGTTVTVPNTEAFSGSWNDNQDGTYTATYRAKTPGASLKATLKMDGWSQAVETASPYDITAGTPADKTSAISTDKASYTTDDELKITVTLKDAQGNAVSGKASALTGTTVTVPNTEAFSGSWNDNQDGTYTATYRAKTPGASLKATLKMDGWSQAVETASPYDITAGTPADKTSAISTDKDSYTAEDEMKITVTLKDAQGNAVSGKASALTGTTVTVPNTEAFSGSWNDNQDGTYTATYKAKTAGSDLKATLKMDGWSQAVETASPYNITAGTPADKTSAISTDKDSYTAEDEMKITVTLKDAQGNAVSGKASALTGTTVTVPNTEAFSGSWNDNQDGTYTATYKAKTAGSDLKATLKMDGWSQAVETASPYDITAGTPADKTSAISTDKASYTTDDELKITVTLKDTQGNAVSGKASALTGTTVTVPNTEAFSGSWNDNQDGTYTATYRAKTPGASLKATLKMDGWSQAVETASPYNITAGTPADKTSAISTDKDSYTAEDEMKITVTLKDAQGNAVSGKASALTGTTVTVPNTEAFSGSWNDNQDGTYTATYKAKTAGSDLKATLKMDGWSQAVETASPYNITAGAAVAEHSAIAVDKTSYTPSEDLNVTVTLKDAQGNGVSGKSSLLAGSAVTVPNASSGSWNDNQNGTYTAIYKAKTVGSDLRATLKMDGWSQPVESDNYDIVEPELKDILVNGYIFNKGAGIPTTGFTGATFKLELTSGNASDFSWTSDASWVSVTDGVVKFTNTGTANKVTITGKPKSGFGKNITYSFTLNSWFTVGSTQSIRVDNSNSSCSGKGSLPAAVKVSLHNNYNATLVKGKGALWNEWGELAGLNQVWTSDINSSISYPESRNYYVESGGVIKSNSFTAVHPILCQKDL